MPLVGYNYYSISNRLSKIWVMYMRIDAQKYFEFAFPAICFFTLALTFPISNKSKSDEGASLQAIISRCSEILSHKKKHRLNNNRNRLVCFAFSSVSPK
jgi:hypothetical protein